MKGRQAPLNESRLAALFALLKASDSVEIKLNVADEDRDSAIKALDLDVLDAELREVVFFDTPGLRLSEAGVVARARRSRKGGDSVIKLRPVVPDELPEKLRRSKAFTIEVDVMGTAVVCSGALKARADNADVRAVVDGQRSIRKLFLPEQRALYTKYAPHGLDMKSLLPFGPIRVVKMNFAPNFWKGRTATAELWFYPDSSRLLEISTRCAPDEAFQVLTEARTALAQRGIAPSEDHQTKTQKALEYFSRLYSKKKAA